MNKRLGRKHKHQGPLPGVEATHLTSLQKASNAIDEHVPFEWHLEQELAHSEIIARFRDMQTLLANLRKMFATPEVLSQLSARDLFTIEQLLLSVSRLSEEVAEANDFTVAGFAEEAAKLAKRIDSYCLEHGGRKYALSQEEHYKI